MYKALIVDDEILDLEGMRTFIPWTELGLEVVDAVHNGFEALSVMERESIDVLVTDVHMPGMSGLDLVRKAKELYGRIKVIFVSGYQDFNYVKQAISLHAYNYVLKPMDDTELTEALKKIVLELDAERQREKRSRLTGKPPKTNTSCSFSRGTSRKRQKRSCLSITASNTQAGPPGPPRLKSTIWAGSWRRCRSM
ncbi:response regulator [Paenibacillus sp. JTLBN-2024]